ncbi:retropepsin-like aspartic protease [Aquimarina spongiae]|uniref:Aspartyl protease n=1 Tax=Aquimarina spongiae TaxID=570521 RepID=A0A1M6A2S7_9FLAO|nr:retropepsin-like aspartic protease [Aquimarina spongiae]SHI30619.1 Aspartyl protease [Aquimarina spongiae]
MKKILLLALLILSNSPVQAHLNPNLTSPILKEIPFDFSQNLPVIEVNIKGNNYRFLFDTAAAHSVVSEHLFTELGLNVIKKQSIADSNNNITQLKVCQIDAMSLNGINFQNKPAVVTALDKSYKIGCLNIDGVFGNDVMKDYFWGIDYKKQIITLTDDKFLFNIPEEAHVIKYNTAKHSFTPKVVLKIDGKKVKNLSFDTGYNKSIFLNKSFISAPLNMESTITYYGSSGEGLFGGAKPKTFYRSMLKNVQIGSLKVNKALATLNDGKPRIR